MYEIAGMGRLKTLLIGLAFFVSATWATISLADTVIVKYRGPVDLAPFECHDITRSSFVNRVCYHEANAYMVIKLRNTYYHYCEIDPPTVATLLSANSMGRYYNANIKSSSNNRRFDCQTHRVPEY